MKNGLSAFENVRGEDGRVRENLWDYVCVEGWDLKEKQLTEFSPATLTQMIENFAARGDFIPYDFNHQSAYTEINGKAAPALAFAGALAAVWDGKIVAAGVGVNPRQMQPPALDPAGLPNGLYAFRVDVTDGDAACPLGQQLLPGFKFVSPMFTSHGQNRHGEDVGYQLIAIACTNTPWQSGTRISFENPATGAPSATSQGGATMARKLSALSKFVKFEEGGDDAADKMAVMAKMGAEAGAAAMDEGYNFDEGASRLEEMAKLYEDAHFEDDKGGEEPHVQMRKMAAKFRKLGKMAEPKAADPDHDGDAHMSAFAQTLGIDAKGKSRAQLMDAIKASTVPAAKLPELVKLQVAEALGKEREERQAVERKERAATIMSALSKDYPGDRDALLRLAEQNPDEAQKLASQWLPKTGAPAQLFSTLTRQGAPIGTGGDARTFREGAPEPKVYSNRFGEFSAPDEFYADAIRSTAESKDPAVAAKVDSHIVHADQRPIMFHRLVAARKVVLADRPEFAKLDK